jgi:hypothetical protein
MKAFTQLSDTSDSNESGVADRFVSNHALLDRWRNYSAPLVHDCNSQQKSFGYGFGWRQGIKLADEQYMV